MSDSSRPPFDEAREIAFKHGLLSVLDYDETDWVEIAEMAGSDWQGLWHFPIPDDDAATRLAWAEMRRNWMNRASDECVSKLVHPAKVLKFIESCPGLTEACETYPEVLAEYVPFLVIPGFSGRFEQIFDEVLKRNKGKDVWFLRAPNFGEIDPYDAMHKLVCSGSGDEHIAINGMEMVVWLLSEESSWLPKEHRSFLIEAAKAYGAWAHDNPNHEFIRKAIKWEVFQREGVSEEMIALVLKEIKRVCEESGWQVDQEQVFNSFLSHHFIDAWLNPDHLRSPNWKQRSDSRDLVKDAITWISNFAADLDDPEDLKEAMRTIHELCAHGISALTDERLAKYSFPFSVQM